MNSPKRPNQDALYQALNIYRDAMRPFILRNLKTVQDLAPEDRFQNEADIDIGNFPHLFRRYWRDTFEQHFDRYRDVRSAIGLITETRNQVSHPGTEDLDSGYTLARLHEIADILGRINAPDQKQDVEVIRDKLLTNAASTPETKPKLPRRKTTDLTPGRDVIQAGTAGQTEGNNVTPSPDPRPGNRSSKREKYRSYFQRLIDELREQHSFTNARVPGSSHYYNFSSGFTGIGYMARFNKAQTVHTQLHIDFRDYEKNKNFFDTLREREAEINAKFGAPLYWDRRDDLLQCRIHLSRDGTIESDESELEDIRAWQIENLLKFKEVFAPEIEMAREKLSSRETESE